MTRRSRRHGYATVLAMFFIVLLLCLWGVAYRQTAAELRMASVQSNRIERDKGCTVALAQALQLLETGTPPASPYSGSVVVSTSSGNQTFTITYTSEGTNAWAVQAMPTPAGAVPAALPSTFGP